MAHIHALMQDCSNSIANSLELLQCCTKPSICNDERKFEKSMSNFVASTVPSDGLALYSQVLSVITSSIYHDIAYGTAMKWQKVNQILESSRKVDTWTIFHIYMM